MKTASILKFFGVGADFLDENTSAYFTEGKEMVIIDLPVSSLRKLKLMELENYKDFYVLITHTHGDHIGGLGLFIQWMTCVYKKNITIIAPSPRVANDLALLLDTQGVNTSWYKIILPEEVKNKKWFKDTILTKHAKQLKEKCFGYNLEVAGKNIVYTGDTCTLDPFKPYLKPGTIFYVDVAVYFAETHLKLEDVLDELISYTKKGIKVFLMHLDDQMSVEDMISKISHINVAPVE